MLYILCCERGRKMKKVSKICSMLFAILMCISNAFAIKHMDVEVRVGGTGEKAIGFFIREGKKRKYFWSCILKKNHSSKGEFSKPVIKFLYKINGLTIPETSPMYNSMMEACTEYDNERDSYPFIDFESGTIYIFDCSPKNKHFRTIINNLRVLSECYFDLNLLENCIIR